MHVYSYPVPHGRKASKEIRELAEMPTSGDVKSGDYLFFTTPPPGFQWRPLKDKLTQPQWEWLKTLYEVLHEIHTIKLRDHRFDAKIIIVSDQILVKMPQKPLTVLRIRKIQILRKKWRKSQTKARKRSKDD